MSNCNLSSSSYADVRETNIQNLHIFPVEEIKGFVQLTSVTLPLQLSKAHVHNLVHLHRIEIVLTEKKCSLYLKFLSVR